MLDVFNLYLSIAGLSLSPRVVFLMHAGTVYELIGLVVACKLFLALVVGFGSVWYS